MSLSYANLAADLTARGYSAASDPQQVADAVNGLTLSTVGIVTTDAVLTWGAENGVLSTLQTLAATPGHPLQNAAIAVLLACQGNSKGLDLSSAKIQAMVSGFVAAGSVTQAASDALTALGTSTVSYAVATYGRLLDYADVVRAWESGNP